MDTKWLEEIGLTGNESLVYLGLFKLGACKAHDLIRETGLHKSRVYDSLERLLEKGLVSSTMVEGVKYFAVLDPEHLLDFIEERKKRLETLRMEAKKALPAMIALREGKKPRAEAQVLFGVEGFKTMRRDLLQHTQGEHLMIGAIAREPRVMPVFFSWYTKQRILKKIKQRVLFQQTTDSPAFLQGKLFQSRYLPPEVAVPAVINIYGDRVVNVLWKGNYPLCFMLVNQDIADAYREYFEVLWKISAKK